jgi:hypothetical protein
LFGNLEISTLKGLRWVTQNSLIEHRSSGFLDKTQTGMEIEGVRIPALRSKARRQPPRIKAIGNGAEFKPPAFGK